MFEPRIRKEYSSDHDTIRSITELAFRDMPYAGGDEQDVIDRLRSVTALTLSLVAVLDEEIVGHIAFSPAEAEDGSCPWFALGPVSVVPKLQRKGIGSALIKSGLAQIRNMDARGCILTGNPQYYKQFGFQLAPENCPLNEPAESFMRILFSSTRPAGRFSFHKAFYGDA